jgi:hypothetical protein
MRTFIKKLKSYKFFLTTVLQTCAISNMRGVVTMTLTRGDHLVGGFARSYC